MVEAPSIRVLAALLALACGCGRFHFDLLGDANGDGGGDDGTTGDGGPAPDADLSIGPVNIVAGVGQTYLKPSNSACEFGETAMAMSVDGTTLVVGAGQDSSGQAGVGANPMMGVSDFSGAVYVWVRNGATWQLQQFIKASTIDATDQVFFGAHLALSKDGNTLAVGAYGEASNSTGIGGTQNVFTKVLSGAVYIFVRTGTTWTQQEYIKASNADAGDGFGVAVSLSDDGNTLAVGSQNEASGNGMQSDNSATDAGAVYIFNRSGTTWTQTAYVKSTVIHSSDEFGLTVALSPDASLLAVGAIGESSNATGIDGNQHDTSVSGAGAVYILAAPSWTQVAYLKPQATGMTNAFGLSLAWDGPGDLLAVGDLDASDATGVNGDPHDTSMSRAGAVYIFENNGGWMQQAYLKASNTVANAYFGGGTGVSFSRDGKTLAVGGSLENGSSRGVDSAQNNLSLEAGAVYVFTRSGSTWSQFAYVKSSNSDAQDEFGSAVVLQADGSTLAIGAAGEASFATGVDGNQTDNSKPNTGAVYIIPGM